MTLAVAALALLPPLQDRLRKQAVDELEGTTLSSAQLGRAAPARARPAREAQDGACCSAATPTARRSSLGLRPGDRADGRVVILRSTRPRRTTPRRAGPGRHAHGGPRCRRPRCSPRSSTAPATRHRGAPSTTATAPSSSRPLFKGDDHGRPARHPKPLTDVATAVDQVRAAFLAAALVGLAVALVLGIALAHHARPPAARACARRPLRIASEGPDAPPPRDDTAATRSATSPARSRRCRRRCAARSRRGARSSRPPRTSCARR